MKVDNDVLFAVLRNLGLRTEEITDIETGDLTVAVLNEDLTFRGFRWEADRVIMVRDGRGSNHFVCIVPGKSETKMIGLTKLKLEEKNESKSTG